MARQQYAHTITVEGRYSFPIDMLRYDCMFPLTENDSGRITNSHEPYQAKRSTEIQLTRSGPNYWEPNHARWLSFGWKVTQHDKQRVAA